MPCIHCGLGKLAGGGTLGLGVSFSDYSEFQSSYKLWLADELTPMRIGHSQKYLSSCTNPTSKDSFPYRRITFEYCRAGKSRFRGNGILSRQRYLATGCLCKMSVMRASTSRDAASTFRAPARCSRGFTFNLVTFPLLNKTDLYDTLVVTWCQKSPQT